MEAGIYKTPQGRPTPMNRLASDPELHPEERLALCIVAQAAHDLRRMKEKKKRTMQIEGDWLDQDDLVAFFRSRWCSLLLNTTGMSGTELLEKLEP